MNSPSLFAEFSRQSPKGILIIYTNQLYRTLKISWILIFLIVKDFSKFSSVSSNMIVLGFILVLIFFLIRAFLIYKNFLFKIENNHFILHQGIFSKTNTSISFDRIQNINLKQNLVQQLIQVYEVAIETAGSTKTEIAIRALSYEKALELKKQIQIGSTEKVLTEKVKPLLRINPKELFKVSITENHLKSLLLLLAIIISFIQQIQQIFDSLGSQKLFDSVLDQGSVLAGNIILFVITILLFLFGALISSFVRVFLLHFNLTVFVKTKSFEINQGLLNKKSLVLKLQKIQNIIVSTNPIKRRLGISFITFKQAVSGKQNKKNKKLIRIVGCKENQINTIKNLLFPISQLDERRKEQPDLYYRNRIIFWSTLFLLVINVFLFFNFPRIETALFNLLLIPLFVILIYKKVKKRFFVISDEMLCVGSGMIETHHTFFELFKVQNIKMKQTYFQKKRNVVDLILQSASGKIWIPCVPKNRANQLYNFILFKVETSSKQWM